MYSDEAEAWSRESEPLYLGKQHDNSYRPVPDDRKSGRRILYILFTFSIALNLLFGGYLTISASSCYGYSSEITKYAKLARDVPTAFNSSSAYGTANSNETHRSLLWESFNTSIGEISLDKTWARLHQLPESKSFLWDQERSTYVLNGPHSLHCLRKVRRWVTISYYNGTQLDNYHHVVHCMDHLLQNILCDADDTPMYTSSDRSRSTGLGQQRMCRSWKKLVDWAGTQTACFGFINETQGLYDVAYRFRYCPKDNRLLGKMRQYFGYDDDWFRDVPGDIETLPPYWNGLPS